MKTTNTRSLVYTTIAVALLIVLSQITIPIGPVPFTLQTLAVGLVATFYRPKEATLAVTLYILLAAIGLPVLAHFSGGIVSLTSSPTAGFVWGFLAYALVTSFLTSSNSHPLQVILANILGDCLCFACGILFFKFNTGADWSKTIALTTLPFIIPEIAKLSLVTVAHQLLKSTIKKIGLEA